MIQTKTTVNILPYKWILWYTGKCYLDVFQDTLAEATALLTELESQEQSDMEVGYQSGKEDDALITRNSPSPVLFTHSPAEPVDDIDNLDKHLWSRW